MKIEKLRFTRSEKYLLLSAVYEALMREECVLLETHKDPHDNRLCEIVLRSSTGYTFEVNISRTYGISRIIYSCSGTENNSVYIEFKIIPCLTRLGKVTRTYVRIANHLIRVRTEEHNREIYAKMSLVRDGALEIPRPADALEEEFLRLEESTVR